MYKVYHDIHLIEACRDGTDPQFVVVHRQHHAEVLVGPAIN